MLSIVTVDGSGTSDLITDRVKGREFIYPQGGIRTGLPERCPEPAAKSPRGWDC